MKLCKSIALNTEALSMLLLSTYGQEAGKFSFHFHCCQWDYKVREPPAIPAVSSSPLFPMMQTQVCIQEEVHEEPKSIHSNSNCPERFIKELDSRKIIQVFIIYQLYQADTGRHAPEFISSRESQLHRARVFTSTVISEHFPIKITCLSTQAKEMS